MRHFIGLAGAAAGGLFLASCETYPYQSAFSSCESEANACYRLCEDIPDERGYVACQAHCDRDIDRCFDTAYSSYYTSYNYYGGYGYSSPWYGRYGSWYPDTGYYLSFNYYDRYGYRKKRHKPHHDYYGRDRDDRRDRWDRNRKKRDRRDGDANRPPRPQPLPRGGVVDSDPPPAPPETRPVKPWRDLDRERPDRTRRIDRRPLPSPSVSPPPASPTTNTAVPPPARDYTPTPRTPRRTTPPARRPAPRPADAPPPAAPSEASPPPEGPSASDRPRRNPKERWRGDISDSDED